jgi:carboxyl-terminal processing protease
MINSNTGFIRINNFAINTYEEFMKELGDLKSKGMTKLILDLRQNSGGVMESAIKIANEFLKEGQMIVYTKGRSQPKNEARATGKGEFEKGELVVLIDEYSASASEILAGAIQDNDRGTIMGRRSFGKGLVQEPVTFADGSGMRLTIARYYTPTGRSIQKPYKDGFDKYFDDLNNRLRHGEMEVSDSIRFPDSLKFTTPGGRIVYGGGGIMPDIFVPVDTSGISPYFMSVQPLIYRFALKYTESNRESLKKYTDIKEFEKYLDGQDLLGKFVSYASAGGVKKNPEGINISGKIIRTQLKAYIARNILDNKGFYPIWEELDTTLKSAVSYIQAKNEALNTVRSR